MPISVTLRRIDLTGNMISDIEDGAFSKLAMLEELSLAENRLVKLPMLPSKLTSFNANFNQLGTKGVKATAFKVWLRRLHYCIDAITITFYDAVLYANIGPFVSDRNSPNWSIYSLLTIS